MSNPINFIRTRPTAWVRVTGEDSAQFLQSQFSNDLSVSAKKACVYGLWLDRKGRIAADSFVLRLGPKEFVLTSYDSPASAIISKLEAFIIADDVELADETESMMLVSLWGVGAEKLISSWEFRIPPAGEYVEQGGMFVTHGLRSHNQSFDIYIPEDGEDWILQRLSQKTPGAKLEKASDAEAELERIRCAIPRISAEGAGGVIPQELGLDSSAVSFNKGCYLGQEVMARVRQTGRFTRELHKVRLDGQPPAPPAVLTLNEAEVGQLTSAAKDPENGWTGLALLKTNRIENNPGPFLLQNNTQAHLAINH